MRLVLAFALIAATVVTGCASSHGGGTGGDEASSTGGASSTGSTDATSSSSVVAGSSGSSGSSSGSGCASMYTPSGFTCSGGEPTLSADVVPITTKNCALSNCHAALDTAGGVENQLVGVVDEECSDGRLLINPDNPECSYVIHKLTGTNASGCLPATTMPLDASHLAPTDIQTIYDWICQGAKND